MTISEKIFGTYKGNHVIEYTLQNNNGITLSVMNYGATVTKIITADRHGESSSIVTGFHDLEGYLQKDNPYFGCIAGRYCNRIAHAKFILDGIEYNLPKNNNGHCLHGGIKGFDKVLWDAEKDENNNAVKLHYTSKD